MTKYVVDRVINKLYEQEIDSETDDCVSFNNERYHKYGVVKSYFGTLEEAKHCLRDHLYCELRDYRDKMCSANIGIATILNSLEEIERIKE